MVTEMSGWGNVLVEKCPFGKLSVGELSVGDVSSGKYQSLKCPVGEMSVYLCYHVFMFKFTPHFL